MHSTRFRSVGIVSAFGALALVTALIRGNFGQDDSHPNASSVVMVSSRSGPRSDRATPRDPVSAYSVVVRKPSGPPRIELSGFDPQGRSASVACSTCHQVRKPNYQNVAVEDLDEFHVGMSFAHGKIACYACHHPDGSDSLRLADGRSLEYENVMTLCSQCHGPQATAYSHGAHGGMNGFWDLTRGPQTKNNCVDCHDPHSPAYPSMVVGFKPKDRFNSSSSHDSHEASEIGKHEH